VCRDGGEVREVEKGLLIYYRGSRQILTKSVPVLQPTLHRQDNSPLQLAPADGND
jgi:hypothetical protein